MKNPTLPLTQRERTNLRKAKVKLAEIADIELDLLKAVLDTTLNRAKELKALAVFQRIPSIGYHLADKLVYQVNLYSLEEVKTKDAAKLLDQLEIKLGVWTDPCVEDQLRCVIHYANHPDFPKPWYEFTGERKRFRSLNGYPSTRPAKAWNE
ncbi:helix-hairpin-helix domain-containing protein [Oceanobacillus salinisoli]|uniref:helix-hairpin-helix domain-containing protein n=1 Tax=Oceanobacillus salinisoli TaxID=2678611 RepID=UPI001E3D5942|nr:helix-hairpin-helix domain-containing protein [Oceanobacillus salinisoli]